MQQTLYTETIIGSKAFEVQNYVSIVKFISHTGYPDNIALTSILHMAATLIGNFLGTLLSWGNTGKLELSSAGGDAANNSEKYDSPCELENVLSCGQCQQA